jgi:hypothetical protein
MIGIDYTAVLDGQKYIKCTAPDFGINQTADAFVNCKIVNSKKTNAYDIYGQINEASLICLKSVSGALGTDFYCRIQLSSYYIEYTLKTQPYLGVYDSGTTYADGDTYAQDGKLKLEGGPGSIDLNFNLIVNDKTKILNIKDSIIDKTSFDISASNRNTWKFARQLDSKNSAENILNQICFESWNILNFSEGKYKLIPFNNVVETNTGTWVTPATSNGTEMVRVGQTSLNAVYTDFNFDYAFHYAKGSYSKNKTVKMSESVLCQSANYKYKLRKTYALSLDWIQDSATMDLFSEYAIRWHTKRRSVVEWSGDFKTYCSFDIGDKLKINHSMIPNTLRNSAIYMITDKRINFKDGDPFIDFKLIEVS